MPICSWKAGQGICVQMEKVLAMESRSQSSPQRLTVSMGGNPCPAPPGLRLATDWPCDRLVPSMFFLSSILTAACAGLPSQWTLHPPSVGGGVHILTQACDQFQAFPVFLCWLKPTRTSWCKNFATEPLGCSLSATLFRHVTAHTQSSSAWSPGQPLVFVSFGRQRGGVALGWRMLDPESGWTGDLGGWATFPPAKVTTHKGKGDQNVPWEWVWPGPLSHFFFV